MKQLAIAYMILGLVIFLILTGYLFYFADCEVVKDFWLIVPVPGRCIL